MTDKNQTPTVLLRRITEADLESVAAIESACFSDPWSPAVLAGTLSANGSFALIAELDGAVGGYLFASFLGGISCENGTEESESAKPPCECELQNIAVSPAFRRKGIATSLLCALIRQCEKTNCARIMLEVREGNAAARALYRAFDFFEVGVRKNYYTNPKENAVLMDRLMVGATGKHE